MRMGGFWGVRSLFSSVELEKEGGWERTWEGILEGVFLVLGLIFRGCVVGCCSHVLIRVALYKYISY